MGIFGTAMKIFKQSALLHRVSNGFVIRIAIVLAVMPGAPMLFAQQARVVPVKTAAVSPALLDAGFADPPAPARLRCYWWWLNGHTTKATITRDETEKKRKGYGGARMVMAT